MIKLIKKIVSVNNLSLSQRLEAKRLLIMANAWVDACGSYFPHSLRRELIRCAKALKCVVFKSKSSFFVTFAYAFFVSGRFLPQKNTQICFYGEFNRHITQIARRKSHNDVCLVILCSSRKCLLSLQATLSRHKYTDIIIHTIRTYTTLPMAHVVSVY